MQFLLDLHPIIADGFIESLHLLSAVLGSWYAAVCTGKVADFVQIIGFIGSYVAILVNM